MRIVADEKEWQEVVLNNIKELDISNDCIVKIPPKVFELQGLEKLLLYDNDLTEIPAKIGQLTNLIYLDLGNNRKLRKLPDEIGLLKNLQILDLSDNFFIEKEEVEKIRAMLPNCKILF